MVGDMHTIDENWAQLISESWLLYRMDQKNTSLSFTSAIVGFFFFFEWRWNEIDSWTAYNLFSSTRLSPAS